MDIRRVLIIDTSEESSTDRRRFLGHTVELQRRGCGSDLQRATQWLLEHDGQVDAIALDGLPMTLELGSERRPYRPGTEVAAAARRTPVVDGGGIRAGLERWAVMLADRAEPGIFSRKQVLMVPGLQHGGLAQALTRRGCELRYADPLLFFALPNAPGIGHPDTLPQVAGPTLDSLAGAPLHRLHGPSAARATETNGRDRRLKKHLPSKPFRRADVLAGDIATLRRHAPDHLRGKTIVVEHASEADVDDLRQRGARILVTLMPPLLDARGGDAAANGRPPLAGHSAAVIEALLAALRTEGKDSTASTPLTEDTYLDLLADIRWTPAIRYLQPDEEGVHRFAFVIHPLDASYISSHPKFRWTRLLPDRLVETVAAYMPPLYVSRIVGGRSEATGQRIEGHLFSLGATPRQMLRQGVRFTYDQLHRVARQAERVGARILGLGAFTSVVGDAGITVANEADIAVTSGNSLTVAATLEAAKRAVRAMGTEDLSHGRAMVVGATGSIGAVCARLLAQAIHDVVLVSIEPERLIELKRRIEDETPGSKITIATRTTELAPECDLIVTATSAFGQRVLDISSCKPGAVICDVARPPDISAREAALRPDVLVIESGEVRIPGDVDFGFDIGLPPQTAYACLAETALLAMEGRFEDYTLGREIEMGRVKEIFRLFQKHGFELAGLRSFGKYLSDEDLDYKRHLAAALRADPAAFDTTRRQAAESLARIPPAAKGIRSDGGNSLLWLGGGAAVAGIVLAVARRSKGRRQEALR